MSDFDAIISLQVRTCAKAFAYEQKAPSSRPERSGVEGPVHATSAGMNRSLDYASLRSGQREGGSNANVLVTVRAFLLAVALAFSSPALAGPQDPWTIDPARSRIAFSASQIGSIVAAASAWTGEIVLDPANLAAARIDIRIDTRPVRPTAATSTHDEGHGLPRCRRTPEARFERPRSRAAATATRRAASSRSATSRATPCCPSRHRRRSGAARPARHGARRLSSSASTTASARTNGPAPARSPTR